MFEKIQRDLPTVAGLAKSAARRRAYLEAVADAVVTGRPERGHARRRVKAAVAHALTFATWQSLVSVNGLADAEAVDVMAAMVDAAGGG